VAEGQERNMTTKWPSSRSLTQLSLSDSASRPARPPYANRAFPNSVEPFSGTDQRVKKVVT
jgi:hypothetical protein